MIADTKNIYLFLASIVAALIPLFSIVYFGKPNFTKILITFFIWFIVFAVSNVLIKDTLIWNWFLMIVINFGIMFALMLFFSGWFITLGSIVRKKLWLLTWDASDVIINLWVWFFLRLFINYVLLIANLYYAPILWLLFILNSILIYFNASELKHNTSILLKVFDNFSIKNANNISRYISAILIICTIIYIYYGFWMSYIPYPTARDANHAYMALPRWWAENWGIYRQNNANWAWGWSFPIYLSHISYFFWLFGSLGSKFWINPDTAGVVMNFMLAPYTIFAFLALIWSFAKWFGDDSDTSSRLWFDIWRFGVLQWMTSGMWAFLVFVDNKSDFGIMFLGALWLLIGMKYIISISKTEESENTSYINKYNLILSAMLFAFAIISKPTAIFDAMNFGLLLWWISIWYLFLAWAFFLILFVMGKTWLNGVSKFIGNLDGNIYAGIWTILWLFSIASIKNWLKYIYNIALWLWVMILVLLIVKWPLVYYSSNYWENKSSIINVIKTTLLADNNTITPQEDNTITDPKLCTNASIWISSSSQLYSDLKDVEADGYSEDVGRYVWYGQKEFNWWRFWKNILPSWCITINKTAWYLCNNTDKLNIDTVKSLISKWWYDADFLSGIVSYYDNSKSIQTESSLSSDIQKRLSDYINDTTIINNGDKLLVPYKLIIPLNVSFNRSLQNLSSYYTDIWVFWLFSWIVIIIWFIYGIASKNKKLILTNAITLIWWIYWIIVGGAIVWYGIGMISWTVIAVAMTFDCLINDEEEENKWSINWSYLYLILLILYGILQILLNFARIWSQNNWWIFTQYKFSNGIVTEFDSTLQSKETKKFPLKAKDIFDLQFPIYNSILNEFNNNTWNYNILIWWTYARYWMSNQANIYDDWFLSTLAKRFSDGNQCKSYLRLKDKKIKYLVIDPNIASIVMWWGNSSLMDRFFAKIDSQSNDIIQDGAFTMLSKLISHGYIKLYYTNVITSKYAYILSDADVTKYFWASWEQSIALTRAKLATIRFRAADQNDLLTRVLPILQDRLLSGEWYYDLADMFWKTVDREKTRPFIQKAITTWLSPTDTEIVSTFTNDERLVFAQYYSSYQQLKWWSQEVLSTILRNSLQWGSQVIIFEVNQ